MAASASAGGMRSRRSPLKYWPTISSAAASQYSWYGLVNTLTGNWDVYGTLTSTEAGSGVGAGVAVGVSAGAAVGGAGATTPPQGAGRGAVAAPWRPTR